MDYYDFLVDEKKKFYLVEIPGYGFDIRVPKRIVLELSEELDETSESIAILLAVAEFQRHENSPLQIGAAFFNKISADMYAFSRRLKEILSVYFIEELVNLFLEMNYNEIRKILFSDERINFYF